MLPDPQRLQVLGQPKQVLKRWQNDLGVAAALFLFYLQEVIYTTGTMFVFSAEGRCAFASITNIGFDFDSEVTWAEQMFQFATKRAFPWQTKSQCDIASHPPGESARLGITSYLAEILHLVQHLVHLRNHIFAVHLNGCVGAIPQSNVEHRSVLKEERRGRTAESPKQTSFMGG